jgi:hypothetical protein
VENTKKVPPQKEETAEKEMLSSLNESYRSERDPQKSEK